MRNHRTDAEPVRTERDGRIELVWQVDGAPMRVTEDAMPPGYDPLALVQISEFASWGEVARWASETFETGPVDANRPEFLRDQAWRYVDAGYSSLWSAQAIGRGFMLSDAPEAGQRPSRAIRSSAIRNV